MKESNGIESVGKRGEDQEFVRKESEEKWFQLGKRHWKGEKDRKGRLLTGYNRPSSYQRSNQTVVDSRNRFSLRNVRHR